jgi:hypothetical protein
MMLNQNPCMTHFAYVARKKSGERVTGTLEAADKNAALTELNRMGLFPVSISTPTSEGKSVPEPAALTNAQDVPLGDPEPQAGAASRRSGWTKWRVARPVVALLLVIGAAVFVLPKFLPGAVKDPPAGWVPHDHPKTGSTIYLPPDWKFLSDDYASRKGYFARSTDDYLYFVNDKHPFQQMEVVFFGWNETDKLQAKGVRGFLTDSMLKEDELNKGLKEEKMRKTIVSQVIHDVAGGTASETVIEGWDKIGYGSGVVKSRQVTLVAKNLVGAKQIVTLSLTVEKKDFDEIDTHVFRPMLESFVYCGSRKAKEADRRSR